MHYVVHIRSYIKYRPCEHHCNVMYIVELYVASLEVQCGCENSLKKPTQQSHNWQMNYLIISTSTLLYTSTSSNHKVEKSWHKKCTLIRCRLNFPSWTDTPKETRQREIQSRNTTNRVEFPVLVTINSCD